MIVFWHWRLWDAKRGRSSSGTAFCVARHVENGDGRVDNARLLCLLGNTRTGRTTYGDESLDSGEMVESPDLGYVCYATSFYGIIQGGADAKTFHWLLPAGRHPSIIIQ